jgi:hypothetical protein
LNPLRSKSANAAVQMCQYSGGIHKGATAPLVGGAAARDVPAGFAGAARVAAWGEPARPGFPPEGETEKGEISFLAAAG